LAVPKLTRLLKLLAAPAPAPLLADVAGGGLKAFALAFEDGSADSDDSGVLRPEASGDGVGRKAGNELVADAGGGCFVLGADHCSDERSSILKDKKKRGKRRIKKQPVP
jgi:hypothetical protein